MTSMSRRARPPRRALSLAVALLLCAGAAAADDPSRVVLRDVLYITGSSVTVDRDVGGDLVAAGGAVTVSGRVAEDALVAGGTVTLDGDIGDVLRVAGGSVSVRGHVGGYLVAGGGDVELAKSGSIAGGMFVNAGEARVLGVVHGPLEVRGGTVRVDGTVDGEVTVYAGRLVLGDTAVLRKGLAYGSRREAAIAPGAQVLGATTRLPEPPAHGPATLVLPVPALVRFLGLVLSGIALVLVFPGFSRSLIAEVLAHFRRDAVLGGGVLLVGPVAAVLLMASLVGLPLGVLGGLAYVIMVLLSVIAAGLVLGTLVWRAARKPGAATVDWKTALVGLALLPAVAWVPLLGWAVFAVLLAASLGSLSVLAYRAVRRPPLPRPAAPSAA
jgi:hypothetical protein